jgi:hypothetical protein
MRRQRRGERRKEDQGQMMMMGSFFVMMMEWYLFCLPGGIHLPYPTQKIPTNPCSECGASHKYVYITPSRSIIHDVRSDIAYGSTRYNIASWAPSLHKMLNLELVDDLTLCLKIQEWRALCALHAVAIGVHFFQSAYIMMSQETRTIRPLMLQC